MVHLFPQSIDRKHPTVLVNDAALVLALPHTFGRCILANSTEFLHSLALEIRLKLHYK